MHTKLLRLALVTAAAALMATPSTARAADGACPGNITDGSTACHNSAGTSCADCTYVCDGVNGFYRVRYNMCGF